MKNNMKIGFIGVGKLGLDCSEVIAEKYDVVGYDIKPFKSELVKTANSIGDVVQGRDIIFIAVPTPHDSMYGGERPTYDMIPKNFDYSIVVDVLKEVNKFATKEQLVVLISTTLPGTVRSKFIEHTTNYRFIYNPYLIAMGSTKWDMVNPEMIIIGNEDGSKTRDAKVLIDFYTTLMKNDPRVVVGTWDEAESIKIFYNTFISTKIGMVNMIMDVSEKIGNINVDVVTDALANSTKRIISPSYMKAGMGDSGACHPRDNIALRWLSEELNIGYDLFGELMRARDFQAKTVAEKLIDLSDRYNMDIFIHGKSYKPEVPYTDGSYSLLIAHWITILSNKDVVFIDPLCGETPISIKGVVLMAHHSPTTYSYTKTIGSDAQLFYTEIEEGSVILDIWRYINPNSMNGCIVIPYGNTRSL
jgi:UDPglucose 6-dehydrogenase